MMALTACNRNPFGSGWKTPFGTAPFSKISEADYLPAIRKGIEQRREEIRTIVANPEEPTFENTIAPYELSGELLARVSGVFFNLVESDASDAMRDMEEEISPELTAASDEIFMDPDFFARVKKVYDGRESLDREQQMVVKKLYETFVRNGVGLEGAARERFKEINTRLAALSIAFGNNLLAENNAFKEKFGVTVSEYPDVMAECEDRDLREAMFRAYSSRGNNGDEYDNNAICLEIMKLRAEKAALLGYPNPASFLLENKMAHDPGTVDVFLKQIMDASMAKARREVADMQALMDKDITVPAGSKIEPWDWFYYAAKVRKMKYDLDENLTKPYFSVDSVYKGVFYAAKTVYGIDVTPAPEVEVYNSSVKAFKVTDSDGSLLGIFYRDPFSRPTKRGGAWMNNFRDQYVDAKGKDVRPVIVNVCNFPEPSAEDPPLLTIDNVQTAFHEFGHALHGLLSKCRYQDVSGTSVTRDFVETFSQFNENWAFQSGILDHYAHDYKTGETIPAALVDKVNNSLKFNQGFMTGELCAASILDMKWHELSGAELESMKTAGDVRAFEDRVCREMGLIGEIIPRYRTTYFNHIFNSGYSAGYYSYLWAEVLDKDAFEYFESNGVFNPEVALKFRQTFLEKGGSEEPMTLYRTFRGQDPDPGALLRARGLTD
ncbi:MAG: M3 family metallopeptidase [Bacteroidales bacterium]|nr:M3 family metallopeptidase [Bacteroidales bacterium]